MGKSFEIRLHGRGGQGGVTCAKLLAACYARLGWSVQTFGDYAGERSGAPVRAYTRVSDVPITNRNKVYHPDHLLVLDPTLLGEEVLAGLSPGGTLLVNTPEERLEADGRFDEFRLATVDATAIAREHGIGTRSLVIVNTTIAGAFAQAHAIPLDVLQEVYSTLGFASNFAAAQQAYEQVDVRDPRTVEARMPVAAVTPSALPAVEPLDQHVSSPAPGLKTGAWSTQRPYYVEHLAPCNAWCPAGNDVVGFVQAAAKDGDAAAAKILGASTPLAAVCGRVCPAPCEEGCNRREYDGAVEIRGLERWIADHHRVAIREVQARENPRHIAVVGSGPAGLSACYSLARAGHRVTLYEGERELGGVLRTGIPSYRLPRDVLDREIEDVLALGIEVRCGEFLDHDAMRRLAAEHDAVVIATGLQSLRELRVAGRDLDGIEQGIQFLHRVNMRGGVSVQGHVVVLGGGNTAMDCARSALRAGAERVSVAYRRGRDEMPAIREEIHEAEQEGVEVLLLVAPNAFHGNGKVQSVELAGVTLGEPDDTGRRRPIVTSRVRKLACDHVLLALGQSADLALLPEGWELVGDRILDRGTETNVFAAGDVSTGDGTVTHAIGSGRRAAGLVLQALGEDVEVFARPDRSKAVPVTDIRLDHFERRAPTPQRLLPAGTRSANFAEVGLGLESPLESHRCFSCGHCTFCDTCLVYCPEGIVRRQAPGYEVDYTYCKGCGICVHECPRSGMEMRPR